jgi:hypothetical protein
VDVVARAGGAGDEGASLAEGVLRRRLYAWRAEEVANRLSVFSGLESSSKSSSPSFLSSLASTPAPRPRVVLFRAEEPASDALAAALDPGRSALLRL